MTRPLPSLLLVLLALLCATAPLGARETNIAASLVAETATPAAGSTVTLAIRMVPKSGWHGYWANPGDAGRPPSVEWNLPEGATAGPMRFPVPERLLLSGLMNYTYERDYAKLVDLTVPAELAPGTRLPIRGDLEWLACTDKVCVPERGEIATELVVGDGAVAPADRARFDGWRAALPKPLGSPARFAAADGRLRLAVPYPASAAGEGAYFFPLTERALDYAAPQRVGREGDLLLIDVPAGMDAAGLREVSGVLQVDGRGLELRATPGPVPAVSEGGDLWAILLALGGALLGGLLLNVMPCVFPILSLKALSLARAGETERGARTEALAYTGGVLLTVLGLGGLLLALRATGSAAGWAFQLQDPRVILTLLLLTSAIALNLAGLFELPGFASGDALARRGGAAGAFWTGALAAFVATPCTGPFMGAALGAALLLPAGAAMAIFAGLGLGLALPFLLLGFVPALRRRLPKPGPWMKKLRRVLSVPMFLTALGLAWVLGRQAGVDAMTLGLGAVLTAGLALWWVGARQAVGGRALLPAGAAAAAALAAVLLMPTARAPAEAAAVAADGAEPFSEARLAALRAANRPVFVYFTADWCVTCKVNEAAAIDRAPVRDAFADAEVAVLVGDWTDGDAGIGRFLESHGRSGVPLYLFYRAGGAAPEVLPQLLTPGVLVGAARRPSSLPRA